MTTIETVEQQPEPQLFPVMKEGESPEAVDERGKSETSSRSDQYQKLLLEDEDDHAARVWPIFMARTENGLIRLADLVVIAEELGLECDEVSLKQVIPPDSRDEIFFEEGCHYLKAAVQNTKDDMFGTGGYNGRADEEDLVKKVSPFQGLKYLCGCDDFHDSEDDTESTSSYQRSPEEARSFHKDWEVDFGLCFNAKSLLLLSTLLVFLLVAAGIITFPSLYWLSTSINRNEQMLSDFEKTVLIFSNALERRLLDAHMDSIKDTATTFARITEYLYGRQILVTYEYLENELQIVDQVLVHTGLNLQRDILDGLAYKLEAFTTLASSATSLGAVVAMHVLESWSRNGTQLLINSTAPGFANQQRLIVLPGSKQYLESFCDFSRFAVTTPPTMHRMTSERSIGGRAVNITTLTAYLPKPQMLVCYVSDPEAMHEVKLAAVRQKLSNIEKMDRDPVLGSHATAEITLWQLDPTDSNSTVMLNSEPREDVRRCRLPTVDCGAFRQWLATILHEQAYEESNPTYKPYPLPNNSDRVFQREMTYYNGELAYIAAKRIPSLNAVAVAAVIEEFVVEDYRDRVIHTVEVLNWQFVRTTEIVVARRDQATNRIIPQATSFRFNTTCYGECFRFPESAETALDAFRFPTESGGFIAPDYRPEPVVSLYSLMGNGLDLGLIVERDVNDLRGITLAGLVDIIDSINAAATQPREILLLRWDGFQVSRLFDPRAPCPANVYCLVRISPEHGVVFRTDCASCIRKPRLNENSTFSYITQLRNPNACDAGEEESECNQLHQDLARAALGSDIASNNDRVSTPTTLVYDVDYSGVQQVAFISYLDQFSTALIVKMEEEALRAPIILSIAISAACASGLTALCLILVTLVTQRVLNNIEQEWQQYKAQIEVEKEKFGHFVQYMVPRHMLYLQRAGQNVISEPSPSATIVVVDIVGLSSLLPQMHARHFVRFMTYYVNLLDELSNRYGLFKLRMYGDIYVGVTQLGRSGADQFQREGKSLLHGFDGSSQQLQQFLQNPPSAPPVLNAAAFAAMLLQLVSHEFTHTRWQGLPPKRKPAVEALKEQGIDSIHVDTLDLRVGINYGPVVSGWIDTGAMPKYDCYGSSLALANRMQLTCPPSRIHVTTYYKEELENIDGKLFFDYDPPRKTIVRGRGTVVSYVLRSAYVPVPEDFMTKLGIVRSQEPFFFQSSKEDGSRSGTDSRTASSENSSGRGGHLMPERRSTTTSSLSSGTKTGGTSSTKGAVF